MSVIKVSLDAFEGPLDLLLHLISQAKINIRDIWVHEITEQFLASIEDLSMLDADRASSFLEMASLLLQIKARAMLPKPQIEEEEDPEQVLITRLEEYRKIKEASLSLKQKEETALRQLYKLPEEYVFENRVELKSVPVETLRSVFLEALARARVEEEEAGVRVIARGPYTQQQAMLLIRNSLREKQMVLFSDLFAGSRSRERVITIFLAVLEMLRIGYFSLKQASVYAPIYLYRMEPEQGEAAL